MTEPDPGAWWASAVRQARGTRSIEAFAHEVGASSKTVWRWEHGAIPSQLAQQQLRRLYPPIFDVATTEPAHGEG